MKRSIIYFLVYSCLWLSSDAQPQATTSAERMKGFERKALLEKRSILNGIGFRNIGPSIMGGRIVDLAVNEDNPIEFYIAYSSGGLWYTKNNGQSFVPIFDSVDVISIGSIAVNWKKGIIWVGTGEAIGSYEARPGIGAYKSSDRGKTWRYMGLPESHHISKIILHPTDDNTLWVAAMGHQKSLNQEKGIYKTTDGGKSWKRMLYIDDSTTVSDLVINPVNPAELYATTWTYARTWLRPGKKTGKTSGIYKTADAGGTWKSLVNTDSSFPNTTGIGRIGITLYHKNPQIIYAVVDNQTLIRRDTSPLYSPTKYDWPMLKEMTKEAFANLDDDELQKFLTSKKDQLLPLNVDAKGLKRLIQSDSLNPRTIYDHFVKAGHTYPSVRERYPGVEVYRSENGGLSWQKKGKAVGRMPGGWPWGKIICFPNDSSKVIVLGVHSHILKEQGDSTLRIFNSSSNNVHKDHFACWINPKNEDHIILGTDGGCNITYDGGVNWLKLNVPSMSVAQCYSIAVDNAQPYNVYLGTQDNGLWMGPSTNMEDFKWFSFGRSHFKSLGYPSDATGVFVDKANQPNIYAMDDYGHTVRAKKGSIDFDNTEKFLTNASVVQPLPPFNAPPYRLNWTTPLLISPHDPQTIYFGANVLFRSLHEGEALIQISPDLTNGGIPDVEIGTITAIAESPYRFGLLYAGTDDGNIHYSPDGGYSWQLVSKNIKVPKLVKSKMIFETLPKPLRVTQMVASRYKEGRVYASLSGYYADHLTPYLFASEDHGKTWEQLGTDLPYECINVIKEDPRDQNILYAGTDGGLYVSLDRGKSFMAWTAGLPRGLIINDIAIQERENEIVLGTWGRSIYIAKLDGVQEAAKVRNE